MPTLHFKITVGATQWAEIHKTNYSENFGKVGTVTAADIAAAEQDPCIRAHPSKPIVEIYDYSYGDFIDIHRKYNVALKLVTGWQKQFGSKEYFESQRQQVERARDELRAIANNPPVDKSTGLGLGPAVNAVPGVAGILGTEDGVCVGHGHSDKSAYDYLMNAAQDHAMSGTLLCIEELPAFLEAEVQAYVDAVPPTPKPTWSSKATEFFNKVAGERTDSNGAFRFDTMFEHARQNGVKVCSINSGECSPQHCPSASYPEMRDVNMNAFGKRQIEAALQKYGNPKFVAFCGAAHSNSHEGGIPGFAQIFDIPAVQLTKTGTITAHLDNPTLHGMPSKEEQFFIDEYLSAYDKLVQENRIPHGERSGEDCKKEAVRIAGQLKAANKLPDFAAIDGLKGTKKYESARAKALEKIRTLESQTPKGDLANAIQAIQDDDQVALSTILARNPAVLTQIDGGAKKNAKTLLSSAVKEGDKAVVYELRKKTLEYIEGKIAGGHNVTDAEQALATVLKAENTASGSTADPPQVDVDWSKHEDMVAKLTEDLKALDQSKKGDRAKLLKDLSDSLASGKEHGFYVKPAKKAGKVSIEAKKARRDWLLQLSRL